MADGFKPLDQPPSTEWRCLNEDGLCSSARVADARTEEYADEFNLNDIGLAMCLAAYRALG